MGDKSSSHYEPSQPPVKPVVTIGVAFAVTFVAMAIIAIGIVVLFTRLDGDAEPPSSVPLTEVWQMQPEPLLVTLEGMFLAPLRAEEEEKLHRFAWVNQAEGVARIPIDTAMDLVIPNLPVRTDEAPAPEVPEAVPPQAPAVEGGAPGGDAETTPPDTRDSMDTDSAAAPAAAEIDPAGDSEDRN